MALTPPLLSKVFTSAPVSLKDTATLLPHHAAAVSFWVKPERRVSARFTCEIVPPEAEDCTADGSNCQSSAGSLASASRAKTAAAPASAGQTPPYSLRRHVQPEDYAVIR